MNYLVAMAEICRALGLEPREVAKMSIELNAGNKIRVTAEIVPTEAQMKRVAELVAQVDREDIRTHEDRIDFARRIVRDILEEKARA